jgi:hypothetical protein
MSSGKPHPDNDKIDRIVAEAQAERERRERSYRERALKLFPWICAWCGREFTRKNLRELTVHHKDHDHDHNPPDGSNWELLCLYCHENVHTRNENEAAFGTAPDSNKEPSSTHKPFSGLDNLLKRKK